MATIRDVAKKAGVNPSTVSRVIAGSDKIGKATTEKVIKAMKALKYRPNMVARSLALSSRTKLIGVILPNTDEQLFHNPFFIRVLSAISTFAQDKGYYIIHANAREEQRELEILKDLVRSQWVDGIVLTTVRENDECIAYLNTVGQPYVTIGRCENGEPTAWVDNDNITAMYDATKRMIEKGHQNICFIGGSAEFRVNKDRLDGYKKAMNEAKLTVTDAMVYAKDDSEDTGAAGMDYFLQHGAPEAIVTTDDLIAFGACQTGYERLGRYVTVVGFNNTPVSKYRNPAFSTVEIFAEELGKHAVELLINQLTDNQAQSNTKVHHMVSTAFIER